MQATFTFPTRKNSEVNNLVISIVQVRKEKIKLTVHDRDYEKKLELDH